jgi:FlaA1/EpsC-like NDP-sugar epimerase
MILFNRRSAIVAHDLVMTLLAWGVAYLARYNFEPSPAEWSAFSYTFLPVIVIQALLLWWTGLYKSVWRFASIPDLWNISRAAVVGALAIGLALFLYSRLEGVPRTTLILYPVFLTILLGGPRLAYRMLKDHGLNIRRLAGNKRVLVLGAGRAGEMLARDMIRDGDYVPAGFLDDNPRLKGTKVHGFPVLGTIDQLEQVVQKETVDVVVIAIPSASNAQMRHVVEVCERADIPFRTLPKLQDWVSSSSALNAIREVAIEDLLGRDPVSLDWKTICDGLVGRTVLVSGGGGSIGSELCRQIARLGPGSLVLVEQSEYNLYNIELELRREFPDMKLRCFLGDVTDAVAVDHVLAKYQPHVVFHAAAYKHVPILQSQTREAVKNNILGTRLLAQKSEQYGVRTFIMISTDKAVNPANVMGATKRIAEMYCQMLSRRSGTRFITVRFGNVLGSAGSVVPLFQQQIQAGGPVTVTHPEITRYFMTIPEACQLIMQAAVMGKGGEIFVLDMGEPVKIAYLAEQLIRLSGKVPGKDVEISYTGLRPGEKLYEELFYDQESLSTTTHRKILLAQSHEVDGEQLEKHISSLEKACEQYDEQKLMTEIAGLVPSLALGPGKPDNKVIEFKQAK